MRHVNKHYGRKLDWLSWGFVTYFLFLSWITSSDRPREHLCFVNIYFIDVSMFITMGGKCQLKNIDRRPRKRYPKFIFKTLGIILQHFVVFPFHITLTKDNWSDLCSVY